MKKSKVIVAAVTLTVAGIMSASAQVLVYDYKMDVRNPESTTFVGGVSPYQKLIDTAFTAKNTFTGYLIADYCCEEGWNEGPDFSRDVMLLITRKADKTGKYYLFDPFGMTTQFEDVENHCDTAYASWSIGVYEKGVGGPNDGPDCRYPIAVSKIKTAQVALYFGEDDGYLPGLFFGAEGLSFTYGDQALPFARYEMPKQYGYSTTYGYLQAIGFGTVKPIGPAIGCEGGGNLCMYLDKADGVISGWFSFRTKCGDDVIWSMCSLGVVTVVTCGLVGIAEVPYPQSWEDYGDNGMFAGTWSVKLNTALTKLQDFDTAWAAIMLKHKLIWQTPFGNWIYNRGRFVEALCLPEP